MSEYEVNEEDLSATKSDLEARRDARRRKILENSKQRLEKLNGRISNQHATENKPLNNSHRTFSDPEMETEEMFVGNNSNFSRSPFIQQNVFNQKEQELLTQRLLRNFQQFETEENENINDIFNLNNQESDQKSTIDSMQTPLITKMLKSKLHLIALSIFTYGFVVFGDKYFSSCSIFLPFLIWELTETIIIRPKENSSDALLNILNIVLIMGGIPLNMSQPLIKVIQTLNKVFKDVGVFMFSFVICHVIYIHCVLQEAENKLNVIVEEEFT